MRTQLAILVMASALAWADPPSHVTRNVVFHTTPPGASIVQLKPERGDVGTAEGEMPVDVPLEGNNVSSKALEFEASMPGHKTLIFRMDTRGPSYNLDVNTPVEFTVIEKLEPDGSASALADWLKGNPGLAGAIVATLLAAVGVAIYVVKARNAPPPAVAPQAPAGSYRDHEVESPIAPAVVAAAAQSPPPVAPAPPKDYRDFEVEPPAHVLAAAAAAKPVEPVAAEPVAAEPVEPVAAEPVAVAAEPEPVASEPEPVASEPEPVAAEPEPVASEPEPAAVEPEPAAEPETVEPAVAEEAVTEEVSTEDAPEAAKGKSKRSKKAKAKPAASAE